MDTVAEILDVFFIFYYHTVKSALVHVRYSVLLSVIRLTNLV